MSKRDLSDLLRDVRRAGWSVTTTGGGHLRLCPPRKGSCIYTGSTPSDHRSLANLRAQLKRAGLDTTKRRN